MCGIAGQVSLKSIAINNLEKRLTVMSNLISHRGPDGTGTWVCDKKKVGLTHRRLAVIDLSSAGSQPMKSDNGNVVTYNGEIYNYIELKNSLSGFWNFKTNSDTECILAAYTKYGENCLDHFRGMFSFAMWDSKNQRLICGRDRFGVKPFYYAIVDDIFYFASEAKALLPFLNKIETNANALSEYLTFQYTIGSKTLFEGINQLLPGHYLIIEKGKISIKRYWDVSYEIDYEIAASSYYEKLKRLLSESIDLHARSDVKMGAYLSGGIDSSIIFNLSKDKEIFSNIGFHGRFKDHRGYDESKFATAAAKLANGNLKMVDINAEHFRENISKIIYHLDFPVGGPGSFPQFMVSQLASRHVKVVLGGQGGDEIFGGYARYLIAYLEQCIKAAIDGNYNNGNFLVTIESIVPNLGILREYKPLIKSFWEKGLFESMDKRYFRLIDKSYEMRDEVAWSELNKTQVFEDFSSIFNNPSNVKKEAYFDKMTHFDFKCLLPALLQVEDRMSMAHGLESRVPFLDHPLIELVAKIPADLKFSGGEMKQLLKKNFADKLPDSILNRRDKMGFPVPLNRWFQTDLKDFIHETFKGMKKLNRPYLNCDAIANNFGSEQEFSRKTWGLLSLELWHQQFHDKSVEWKAMANV